MTDSDMPIPPAPRHIPQNRWTALCECARSAIKLERLEVEGDLSAAALGELQRRVAKELSLFSAIEIALTAQMLLANGRAAMLERMLQFERKQAMFRGSLGGRNLPGLGWHDAMGPGYLRASRAHYPDPVWGGDSPFVSIEGRAYYVFIEDVTQPDMTGSVDGPGGRAVDPQRNKVFLEAPMRFRSSGLSLGDFDRIEGRFESLDPEDISRTQRDQRKRDLREHLAEIGLPILDLYMASDHPDLRAVRTMLVAGSWHIIGVSPEPVVSPDCPVLIGTLEDGDGPDSLNHLTFLAAVPAHIEVRLRDIFSLAHIPDARFDIERGEGGRGPPPDLPPEGWDKVAEAKWDSAQTAARRYSPPALEA